MARLLWPVARALVLLAVTVCAALAVTAWANRRLPEATAPAHLRVG